MRALPKAYSKYGAQMGRADNITEPDAAVCFHLVRLRWYDHDYDQGGAYWGQNGVDHIYWAYADGEMEEQVVFVRAVDREQAKQAVRDCFENARFYR